MRFSVIGRIVAHTLSLRLAVFLLSTVTAVYLFISILWGSPSYKNIPIGTGYTHRKSSKVRFQPLTSDEQDVVVSEGRGVWVKGRNIQVVSAIHDIHHPTLSEMRIVLPAFLQHSSEREFVCCFHTSTETNNYIERPAALDFIDLRFVVNMQNAVFGCVVRNSQITANNSPKFVSFAPHSCAKDRSLAIRIVYPVRRSWEFAVCTKVAYGKLEPIRLVEWFEYMREIGASKIVTFHNNLHPVSRHVFDYYADSGFLQLIEYAPQTTRNSSRILYTDKNSQIRQARHEKTLVVHDCQYRLGGYDFVLTIDFDELPVPMRPYGSLNWILQILLHNHTDGAAFRMDPVLLPPEWQNPSHNLYHWQFTTGTYIAPYCVKWAYIPGRTWIAATHEIGPKDGYHTYEIPQDMLHFLHFRTCKSEWHEVPCQNLTQTVKNELTLKRFTGGVLRSLRKLPLEDLIPDRDYIKFVRMDSRSHSKTKYKEGHPLVNLLLTKS